jgi:hypothetical protein
LIVRIYFFRRTLSRLHILDATYLVDMSYVTSYGGGSAGSLLQQAGNVVPGWAYAGRKLVAGESHSGLDKLKIGLSIGAGVVAILLLIVGLKYADDHRKKSGMTSQWLGARHPNEVRLTDLGRSRLTTEKKDTFLGHGVGPEFVEQPNYVLGQEDMQRTALSKWNRLKAQGAQVADWKTFWAAYRAENSDDLDASMYDFGDGFDSKKLEKSTLGR